MDLINNEMRELIRFNICLDPATIQCVEDG